MAFTLAKDYVEHLRTVHFTLIVLCLALLVLASSRTKTEVQIARDHLREIIELKRTWGDGSWITAEIQKQVRSRYPHLTSELLGNERPVIAFNLAGGERKIEINLRDYAWLGGLTSEHEGWLWPGQRQHSRAGAVPAPATLAEFIATWDRFASAVRVFVPAKLDSNLSAANIAWSVSGAPSLPPWPASETSAYRVTNDPGGAVKADFELVRTFDGLQAPGGTKGDESSLSLKYYSFAEALRIEVSSGGGSYTRYAPAIYIPVLSMAEMEVDPQAPFVAKFRHWRHGDFGYSFPELRNVSRNLEGLTLEKLDEVLVAEEKRSGESLEAFGIRFPAERTTRWGILLVLTVQLYLLIHLIELGPRLKMSDEGWGVAWVGIYRSRSARIVTVVSVLILPAVTVGLLSLKNADFRETPAADWLMLAVPTATSFLLALASIVRLPRPPAR